MTRLLIIEDDLLLANDLTEMLKPLSIDVVGLSTNYDDGLHKAISYQPDLVILDIELIGNKTGIDLALELNKINIPYIFLSSHTEDEIIHKAVSTKPLAYLVKPVTEKDLKACLALVLNQIKSSAPADDNFLIVKDGIKKVKIDVEEIHFVKADNQYLEIYWADRRTVMRGALKNFISLVQNETIIQVHKTYAVNRLKISEIKSNSLIISEKTTLPLGRMYKKNVSKYFQLSV